MERSSLRARRQSFTLIELLIVITIIGILAVALLPRITGVPARARDEQRKADLNSIVTALELYNSDNGLYPGTVATTYCLGVGTETVGPLLTTTGNYIQEIPMDPTATVGNAGCTGSYAYKPFPYASSSGSSTNYMIVANLERTFTADSDSIYCFSSLTSLGAYVSYDDAITDLASQTCTSSLTDGYYIVVK